MYPRTWGKWQYDPCNLTLEYYSKVLDEYPEYSVDLEKCNSSPEVLDWLCQVLHKDWCSKKDVGDLLEAIYELAGGLQAKMCSFGHNRNINMRKRLLSNGIPKNRKRLTIESTNKELITK